MAQQHQTPVHVPEKSNIAPVTTKFITINSTVKLLSISFVSFLDVALTKSCSL